MAKIFEPIHQPADSTTFKKKNVVVIIIESFGREYIGAYNKHLEGGKYKGYTPFADSLTEYFFRQLMEGGIATSMTQPQEEEHLIVSLSHVDCTTVMEDVLALALCYRDRH